MAQGQASVSTLTPVSGESNMTLSQLETLINELHFLARVCSNEWAEMLSPGGKIEDNTPPLAGGEDRINRMYFTASDVLSMLNDLSTSIRARAGNN